MNALFLGPIATRALATIQQSEQEFGFDSGVRRVLILSDDPREAPYAPRSVGAVGATVKLYPAQIRVRGLEACALHEMGHALCDRYDLAGALGPFVRRTYREREAYLRASEAAAHRPGRPGVVSGYAACEREEDFCETLAAYLTNRTTWRTRLTFNGEAVAVEGDARLRRKLDAVHALLRDLARFV